MITENSLISTSILTAIWDETRKDNIELIKPFIISIIFQLYKIGEFIDEDFVAKKMEELYGFQDFPIAVLIVVLKRLKKQDILIKRDNKYIVKKDLSSDNSVFSNKKESAIHKVKNTIQSLKEYLSKEIGKDISDLDTEQYLSNFLSTYGYKTYDDINSTKCIVRKSEPTNYLIGEYICSEEKNKTRNFENILTIIEGYMLSNAIYLQIENDNKASLKKLDCYLDSSFLLKVLGLKTEEENNSAKQLFRLLNKYGAKLKCFSHTYMELFNIILYYKNNIGKQKESTLEYFDLKNYSAGQVELYLSLLESKLASLGITIEEKPIIGENDSFSFSRELLSEMLVNHKIFTNSYYSEKTIQNDLDSVCSIDKLRGNINCTKLENCGSIFITTYHYLKVAINELKNKPQNSDIGLVIDDLDLTTILWLKDFNKSSNLPRMRLVENALAATNASDLLFEKAKKIYEEIKADNTIPGISGVSDMITKHYLQASGLVKEFHNDSDLLTKESLIQFIKRKDDSLVEANKQIEVIKKELQVKQDNYKKEIINNIETKAQKKYEKFSKLFIILYKLIIILLFIVSVGCLIVSYYSSLNMFIGLTLLFIDFVGLCDLFISKSKRLIHRIDKLLLNCKRDYISNKINELDEIEKKIK